MTEFQGAIVDGIEYESDDEADYIFDTQSNVRTEKSKNESYKIAFTAIWSLVQDINEEKEIDEDLKNRYSSPKERNRYLKARIMMLHPSSKDSFQKMEKREEIFSVLRPVDLFALQDVFVTLVKSEKFVDDTPMRQILYAAISKDVETMFLYRDLPFTTLIDTVGALYGQD